MKLITLTLQNFRQHASSVVRFPERGIIGITGANEGGKSSIVEAIAWALYGTEVLRGGKGTVRWHRAVGKRVAQVNLVLELGGVTYEVMRTESDAKVWADGTPVAATTSAVNAYIERVLGMAWDEFRSSYLVEQKDLNRLKTDLKGTARRQFFLEVMGVGVVDDALDRCRKALNDIKRDCAALAMGLGDREPLERAMDESWEARNDAEGALEQAGLDVETARAAAAEAQQAFEASAQRERQYNDVGNRIASALLTRDAAEEEVQAVLQSLTKARDAAARVMEREHELQPLGVLRTEREQLRAAKHQQDARRVVSDSIARIEPEIALAEDTIEDARKQVGFYDDAAHLDAEAALQSAVVEHNTLKQGREAARATAVANYEAAEKELGRNIRRRDAIKAAGQGGACPTCGQALGERFEMVIAELQHDIDDLKQKIAATRSTADGLTWASTEEKRRADAVTALTEELQRLRTYREDARRAQQYIDRETPRLTKMREELAKLNAQLAGMTPVPFNARRLQDVETQITRLEQVEKSLTELRAQAARVAELGEDMERRNRTLQTTRDRIVALEQERAALQFDPAQHQQAKTRAQQTNDARDKAERAFAVAEAAVGTAEQQHRRAVQALEQYDARATTLHQKRADLRTHEQTAQRLDDFRRALASTIRPEMEELTSGFVSLLTDGRHESVAIDEDYNVIAQEAGIDVPVVSGGAEDILAIGQRLAVSQMITERAGHPLSLLGLDEPFGSLDVVRRSNVLALIRRLGGVFQQVLLITHIDEIREAADHVIEVTYNAAEGRSYVRQIPEPVIETTTDEAAA